MAGHSKWSKVKHIKGPTDAKRGAAFSKLVKEITVPARIGGDWSCNPCLRLAIEIYRAQNMSKENIERTIKIGPGELAGAHYKEALYEGGVALVIAAATDHKSRPVADLRFFSNKNHGSLPAAGGALFMFHQKRAFTVPCSLSGEDRILDLTLAA